MTASANPGLTRAAAAQGRELAALFAELYAAGSAESYGLAPDEFIRILAAVGARYLPPESKLSDAQSFYRSLRVEELALARACAAGNEHAWEVFLTRYREKLYDAAAAFKFEAFNSRELADSIYADLWGTSTRDGERVSKLASYSGRGSLEGWLRTVVAQEFINRYRRQRKLASLDEQVEAGVQFAAPDPESQTSADPRLATATDVVLAALHPEDRYILSSYFLDQCTLAEIARVLRVHESTISRRLEKITKDIRKRILAELVRAGMSRRQAEEALETDVRDLAVDVRSRLARGSPQSAENPPP
jgi:RNA polymerase sigma-70 factor (ECF subfamily)